jgi:hypothetical protein
MFQLEYEMNLLELVMRMKLVLSVLTIPMLMQISTQNMATGRPSSEEERSDIGFVPTAHASQKKLRNISEHRYLLMTFKRSALHKIFVVRYGYYFYFSFEMESHMLIQFFFTRDK